METSDLTKEMLISIWMGNLKTIVHITDQNYFFILREADEMQYSLSEKKPAFRK